MSDSTAAIAAAVEGAVIGDSLGQQTISVPVAQLATAAAAAKDNGYEMLVDLTSVDYLDRDPRFEVVVNLVSISAGVRLRLLAGVPGGDPTVPTLTTVYPGADFYEREIYDLMGIVFEGHPDLTRILLPDEWVGHPLRKDSSVGAVPVQFKSSNEVS